MKAPWRGGPGGAALAAACAALAVLVGVVFLRTLSGPRLLEPPAPEGGPAATPLPMESSSLVVPLSIPMEILRELLEEAVPTRWGDLDERHSIPGEDRTDLAFELRRRPFRVVMRGSTARVEALVEYSLRAWYDPPVLPELNGSCGVDDEAPPRLRVVLEAPVTLTEDWSLATRTRVAAVEPAGDEDRDRCRMTFLDFDVTDRVVEGAREFLTEQVSEVDEMAASVELRPSFEEWWAILREPIELEDSIWLAMGPRGVTRGPVRGTPDSLRVDLALDANPRVVVGPRPPPDTTPLPPLRTGDVQPGLDIVLQGRAEYGTVSRRLMQEVAGLRLEHEGRTIQVDSLELRSIGGGRVALGVRVSGDLAARLWLTGTPVVDTIGHIVHVPDLDFHVATLNVLVEAASWLRREEFRERLREKALWRAAPAEAWLRGWLVEGLNREISSDLRIRGVVDTLVVQGVQPLPDHFLIRIGARADAGVRILP